MEREGYLRQKNFSFIFLPATSHKNYELFLSKTIKHRRKVILTSSFKRLLQHQFFVVRYEFQLIGRAAKNRVHQY